MTYNWNKDLKPNQDLKIFGSALSYFKECTDELIVQANGQLSIVGNLINSMADRRIYIGASDRTQFAFSLLQYQLRRYCCYNGEVRPDIYVIGRDAVPINDPETDIGIVVTGSTFTKPAVNAMKVLVEGGVKTFLITYTTLEKAREEQKIQKEQGELKESVWDHFIKQPKFEECVFYLPMREESWRKEQRRSSLAPMGTKFELLAGTVAIGLSNGLRKYHSSNENTNQNETPLIAFLNTLSTFRNYLDKDLPEQCFNSRFEIADLVQDLYEINHKKLVGFGGSEVNVLSFDNRLIHCRHLGKGEKFDNNKSVHILRSAYSGFITKNNMVIGISKSGDNPYTSFIMNEAMKQNPEKMYLITCHENPKIDSFTKKIVLPPVISSDEEEIPNNELGHLTIYAFLDSCIAQLAEKLGLDEDDMKILHSRYG